MSSPPDRSPADAARAPAGRSRAAAREHPRSGAAALALATLAVCGLAFANLDAQILWQDEAQSALLARTTLEHGIPLGTDGRNFFSQEQGAEYDPAYRWRWHTWLHLYAIAASFALFGESTWAARAPSALFGVLAWLATFALARAFWPRLRAAAWSSAALLALCVPYWILVRQARYYALAALAAQGLLLGYARMLAGARGGSALFVAAGVALFHTHYVYLPPLLLAVGMHAALWRRDRLRAVLLAGALVIALCAPWVVWQLGMDYGARYGASLGDPAWWLRNASIFARKLLVHVVTPGLALGLLALGIAQLRMRARRRGAGPGPGPGAPCTAGDEGLRVIALAAAALFATLAVAVPDAFFRYLAPLLPLCALGLGRALAAFAQWHPAWAAAGLAVYAAQQPLLPFAHELTHDFDGPLEGLVTFLRERAEPGDVVLITYGDLPLKFYTRLRVVGGLTGEDLEPGRAARWVVLRHHTIHPERDGAVARFIRREIDLRGYRKIALPFTDTPFENREEPAEHRFRSARGGPPLVVHERPGTGAREAGTGGRPRD